MRLQDLPPDLRAALSLVLSRRKSYSAIAAMLSIEERAVHDRAHAALALLAPRQARELTAVQREQVGEYLLGQADPAQGVATRAYLEGSAPARTWAQALTAELAPLTAEPLPEIPASSFAADSAAAPSSILSMPAATPLASQPPEATAPEGEPAPTAAQVPSSRRGGAIVLGALAAIVILAVILIVGLGGGSHTSSGTTPAAPTTQTGSTSSTPSTTPTTTTPSASTTTSTKTSGEPHLDATLTLKPRNSSSKALGLVEVYSQGSAHAFIVAAEHLSPTKGFRYAAWLYNSPTNAFFLGGGPTVGSNGILKAAGGLPTSAAQYGTIVLTEERGAKPTQPGPIVLSGAFKLG